MGMPTLLTLNATATSAVWTPDWLQVPFNINIGAISTAGAGYQVLYTLNDLTQGSGYTAGNATWYAVSAPVGVSTTMNIQFPCTGLQLSVVTTTNGSAVTVNFIQATFPR